jgi:hypothetical protein
MWSSATLSARAARTKNSVLRLKIVLEGDYHFIYNMQLSGIVNVRSRLNMTDLMKLHGSQIFVQSGREEGPSRCFQVV